MSAIVNISDESFDEEVLKAEGPVLVDFWAPWCGPCKMIGPVLEDLSTLYQGRVKICKLDVDENKNVPAKFNIRGIPTLIIFKNGNVESTKVGALSKAQLTDFIETTIA